jgi:2-iminobutanoate/2-iminopropanoate deaminase
MSELKQIRTALAPAAIGPYSQAIVAAGTVYTAGQVGLDPVTAQMVGGSVETETKQALENLRAVLAAAGCGMEDVVKTTVFLADMAEFKAMNEVYARFFAEPFPARSTVQAAGLPRGARVEIDAVARIRGWMEAHG